MIVRGWNPILCYNLSKISYNLAQRHTNKSYLSATAGVENERINLVFSRCSRVFVGEFRTDFGQNW